MGVIEKSRGCLQIVMCITQVICVQRRWKVVFVVYAVVLEMWLVGYCGRNTMHRGRSYEAAPITVVVMCFL